MSTHRYASLGLVLISLLLIGCVSTQSGAERTGAFDEAIGYVRSVDQLSNDARVVGVTLTLPETYDGFRLTLLEQAIAANVRTGAPAARRGEWDKASDADQNARNAYPAPFAQRSAPTGPPVRSPPASARPANAPGRERAPPPPTQTARDL